MEQRSDQLLTEPRLGRRRLLGGGLAALTVAATGSSVLGGCSKSSAEKSAENASVKLPTYAKYEGVETDMSGPPPMLDAFSAYPANPKSVSEGKPGDGKPITFMTNIPGAIPPTMDRNKFWQELNERFGSEIKISMAPNDQYRQKFQTRVASGDLPDVINIPPDTARLPGLLEAKCMDLTEQLSGDAVLKYPFLANLPTDAWKACRYNGKIYGVPIPRGMTEASMPLYREDLLDAQGIKDPQPSNFQEFLDLCKELTAPDDHRWAWGTAPLSYVQKMLGLPNHWKEENGKFTSIYEVPEAKEALEATRKMVAAGVVHPDAFGAGQSDRKQWLNGGIIMFDLSGFIAWNQFYQENTAGESFAVNMLDVPGFDGGEGTPWAGLAINNITTFNKDSEHTVETLLAMMNWMAIPFGTEEYLFRKYGLEGRHFEFKGSDPVPTKVGIQETGIGVQYFADAPTTLYLAGHPEVPKKQFAMEEKLAPRMVRDPSYGLYSEANSEQTRIIRGPLTDLQTLILQGKKPVSDWDAAVKTWRESGGDKIRSEFEGAFANAPDS